MSKTSKASTTSIGSPIDVLTADGYVQGTISLARKLYAQRDRASDLVAADLLGSLLRSVRETS